MSTEQQTDEEIFAASFADEQSEPAAPQEAPSDAQTTEAPAPAAQPATDSTDAVDPFAGLPPAVRELLADIPRMRQDNEVLKRQVGRLPALQRELDQLKNATPPAAAPTAPAPAATRFEKAAKLRSEGLPEIADALEEIHALLPQTTKAPEPTAPPPTQSTTPPAVAEAAAVAAEETLTDLRPTWGQELQSEGFLLWLQQQPPQYRREVEQTGKAGVILKSLQQWDQWKARAQPTTPAPARNARLAAAVTRRGDGDRSRAPVLDDEEAAFMAGFKNA